MTDLSISSFLATTALYLRTMAPVPPGRLPNQGRRDGYRPLKTRRAISRQPAALNSTRSKPGVLRSTAASDDSLRSSRPEPRSAGEAWLGARLAQGWQGELDGSYRAELEALHDPTNSSGTTETLRP